MAPGNSFSEALAAARESVVEEIRAEKQQLAESVPQRALVWMALAPAWTIELAEACDFPAAEGGVAETFRLIGEAELCESSVRLVSLEESGGAEAGEQLALSHTMGEAERAAVLQSALRDPARGLHSLRKELTLIGSRILLAPVGPAHASAALKRWAIFASCATSPSAAATLLGELAEDALARGASGEVLHLIEATRPLEALLGGELTLAIESATRRLELFHRRLDDERHLNNFLERKSQVTAFNGLLDGGDDAWALHYVGPGGMGKTMLIRHLTARLLPQRHASFARLDFDYLNPNYPARSPGLLLSHLALELQNHDQTGEATRLFSSYREKVERTHESLGASQPVGARTLAQVMVPVFDALPIFSDALRKLPQPVVIILDTCEELARIRPDTELEPATPAPGGQLAEPMPRALKATFDILERLRELHAGLRVIFSGRRPLASAGAGWRCPSATLPPRNYLRAHLIRGFSDKEADKYLGDYHSARSARGERGVPPDLVKPIKTQCLIKGETERFVWDVRDAAAVSKRYHPFDLGLYAAWSCDDPELTPDTLSLASADRYVEVRIVGRIEDAALRELLPAVVLLDRFHADVLRAVAGMDPTTFERVFRELSQQEWINRQAGQFLEVEAGLRARLRRYFAQAQPVELEAARRHAASHLTALTLAEPLDKLDASYFATTMRLLRAQPEEAARWWRQAEERFEREEAYDWAKRVCELLMGEEEGEVSNGGRTLSSHPLLRAAVRATYAASLLHTEGFDKLEETWAAVGDYTVATGPAPAEYPRQSHDLLLRAAAGRLVAVRYARQQPDESHFTLFRKAALEYGAWSAEGRVATEQLTASLFAGLEALLEFWESEALAAPNGASLRELKQTFDGFAASPALSPPLTAFGMTLLGRLCVLYGDRREGLVWFKRALKTLLPYQKAYASARLTPQVWLDWLAPEEIQARTYLELVRGCYPAAIGHAEALSLIGREVQHSASADSDRLNSVRLRLSRAGRLSGKDELGNLSNYIGQSLYGIRHKPLCLSHENFPPFFAVAAEEMAAAGEVDQALSQVQLHASDAEGSGEDLDAVLEADRAALRIIRRMRLRDEELGGSSSLDQSLLLKDKALFWAVDGLCNPPSGRGIAFDAERFGLREGEPTRTLFDWVHQRFRTLCTRPEWAANAVINWALKWLPHQVPLAAASSFAVASCTLDCLEVNEIARRAGLPPPFPEVVVPLLEKSLDSQLKETGASLESLTLLLRWRALTGTAPLLKSELSRFEAVGRRRVAAVALEEGELLALRLPERAAPLLDVAADIFSEAGDLCSATVASACATVARGFFAGIDELSLGLRRLEKNYTAFQAEGSVPLRPWPGLDKLADKPVPGLLELLSPRGWRPWLVRIVTCLACFKDFDIKKGPPGERLKELRKVLEASYSATVEGETRLPPELDLDSWALTTGIIGRVADASPVPEPERAGQVSRLTISLEPPQHEWRPLQSASPGLPSFHARVRMEWETPAARSLVETGAVVPGLAEYRKAAIELLKTSPDFLRLIIELHVADLRQVNERRRDGIELRLDRFASWICWEGIIHFALKELALEGPRMFRLWRSLNRARARRVPVERTRQEGFRSLSIVNDLSHEEFTRSAWERKRGGFPHRTVSWKESRSYASKAPTDILHVIGTPVETASGIRLDVAASRRLREGAGSGQGRRGELLRADELTSYFPDLTACVLQSTPSLDRGNERSQSERERAAYLRMLGAELFALGVPAVVVIPPLPEYLTEQTLARFVRCFGAEQEEQLGPSLLLNAVGNAQAMIHTSNAGPTEADIESSLDLCLYVGEAELWEGA